MTDRVFHQLDEQLDDHVVEALGVEVADPDQRRTDLPVVGDVRHSDFLGELLHDAAHEVGHRELVVVVVGVDHGAQLGDDVLRDEPRQRMDVHHDGVDVAAVTGELPHTQVELPQGDSLPAG